MSNISIYFLSYICVHTVALRGKLYVTSDFGERFNPILHNETLHAGIDLRADYEVVNAIADGIIVKEGYGTRAGNYMIIKHR